MARLTHRLTVGRGKDNDIRVRDDTVSRHHATLKLNGDGSVRVIDQGSANGTFLQRDGRWERITEGVAQLDDPVRFGAAEHPLRDLMREVPGLMLLGEDEAEAEALELRAGPAKDIHQRPRRNPETGDIEEQH